MPKSPDLRRGSRRTAPSKRGLVVYYDSAQLDAFMLACHSDGETMTEAVGAYIEERVALWRMKVAKERARKVKAKAAPARRGKVRPAAA